jgi:phenylalanyl-tRNA synthetase beta chain
MKVSLNQLRYYNQKYSLAKDLLPANIDDLVAIIGAQLGAVEEVIDLGTRYKGIVIARIASCEALENSDHLKRCLIDDGKVVKDVERSSDGYVQVITGAPNVHADMQVAWLPPGTVVPSSFGKEPFTLEARPLRGALSNGMLASAKELAIGDSHEGILELDPADAEPGADFAEIYGLNDHVIEIENKMFTHRPDCFGMLGVAREIAGIQHKPFSSPEWYRPDVSVAQPATDSLKLELVNELPTLVPRFMAVPLGGIKVAPSPLWLQVALARLGIRPINNVVDLTNYHMLLTGQPTHAYDYDKLKAQDAGAEHATITVRFPRPDETLTLLNGKTIQPRPEAIMIASRDKLIGIGGVMGGADTEVDEHTTNIVLEVATFDMYSIRRTSMEHGLFTDAVSRFNKGQSPLQNPAVLSRLVHDLEELAGANVAGAVVDNVHLAPEVLSRQSLCPPISLDAAFINSRLGLSLPAAEMAELLKNVECAVEVAGDKLTVTAPFWRTDIELREDVVEEVGRLYGFDKLPMILPKRDLAPASRDPLLELKGRIRSSLARAGANEVLTYSFVHGKLFDAVTQNRELAFKLSNALSPDLQFFRLHALPSLLDKVHANIKAGYDEFALFELNKGHNLWHKDDDDGVPTEIEFLDFVYASNKRQPGAPFYQARRYLDALARDLGLELEYKPITEDPQVPVADPYDYSRSAFVSVRGGEFLGMVGELKAGILQALKLPPQTAAFTVGPQQLLASLGRAQVSYQPLSKFPKLQQDISLKVNAGLHYQELYDFIWQQLQGAKPADTAVTLEPIDIYQRPDDQAHKQITLRLTIASYKKTLTDSEVNQLLEQVAVIAHKELGAERI